MYHVRRAWSAKGIALVGMNGGFDLVPENVTKDRAAMLCASRAQFVERNPELSAIGETQIANRRSIARADGVAFSAQMEQAFQYYEDIKVGVGDVSTIKTIVEVGSGYGRLARILHLLDNSRCYVLVDLPESLLFAYAFLRVNFPKAKIVLFDGWIPEEYDFLLCPIQRLHALRLRPDLLINTYSFAEMTQGCVDYVIDLIETNLRPRFFYSLNMIFSDKSIHFDTGGLDGEANETCLPLRPQWWPERFVLVPGQHDGKPRITGSVVLRYTETSPLVRELLAHGGIGHLYLAALWSRDAILIDAFRLRLRDTYAECGFSLDHFDRIGEVMWLGRAVSPPSVLQE